MGVGWVGKQVRAQVGTYSGLLLSSGLRFVEKAINQSRPNTLKWALFHGPVLGAKRCGKEWLTRFAPGQLDCAGNSERLAPTALSYCFLSIVPRAWTGRIRAKVEMVSTRLAPSNSTSFPGVWSETKLRAGGAGVALSPSVHVWGFAWLGP